MKKSTKGAVAAGAAAVLMLGGAGSLAHWTAEADVAGASISTGNLTLDAADCGAGWTIDGTPAVAFDTGTDKLVPGDVITRVCTMAVSATGKHLVADIAAEGAALPEGAPFAIDTAYQVKDSADALRNDDQVVSGDKQIVATQTVTFKYGAASDNSSQDKLGLALSTYAVSLKQVHN